MIMLHVNAQCVHQCEQHGVFIVKNFVVHRTLKSFTFGWNDTYFFNNQNLVSYTVPKALWSFKLVSIDVRPALLLNMVKKSMEVIFKLFLVPFEFGPVRLCLKNRPYSELNLSLGTYNFLLLFE